MLLKTRYCVINFYRRNRDTIIVALFFDVIFTVLIGLMIFLLQIRNTKNDAIDKIKATNRYNWNMACLILKSLKEEHGVPVWNYDNQIYRDNLGFIHNCCNNYVFVLVENNLALMNLSNNMILFGLQHPESKNEVRINLESPARKILKNMELLGISGEKCPY